MQDINYVINNYTKDNIWLFNSAGLFTGNVKYLFIYISNYRPDIFACYISGVQKNVDYIKSLGFNACHFKSKEGAQLLNAAGVYVNEHCKEIYPKELLNTKILNLYHGVGLKQIEKKADREYLYQRIAKKHITYNEQFSNNMCFLVTSPFMEKHFKEQLDLTDDQIIRGGYPRCIYQSLYEPVVTYNHDIISQAGLPKDTKLALYAPTFREKNPKNFLYLAIKDINILSKTLEKNNLCLIIKLHPEISNDFYFKTLQKQVGQYRNIIFWDNKNDIYEIFNKIDLAIIDYSSIYYDLVSAGVKNFIRYIFDFDDEKHIMLYDYQSHTSGKMCQSFGELINAIDEYQTYSDNNLEKIKELFWSYDDENTFENIINQTNQFKIGNKGVLPTFYSFDVFDTLIGRKCLIPKGIFYKVMELIKASDEGFPEIFHTDYVNIRMQAEANCRELLIKTIGHYEISYRDIFSRIQSVYNLNDSQITKLMDWEVQAEYENVIPIDEMVKKAEQLVKENETVVLISDMYLPKEVISNMLAHVSPLLNKLPLYLSSEYGVQKASQQLYLRVYKDHSPWRFKEWIHYGDNATSDGTKAKELGIKPQIHKIPKINAYETALINKIRNYNSYLLTGLLSRMRFNSINEKDYFCYAHVSGYMVPYVAWCIRDAIDRGIETLYFVSRDGHFLKEIADAYISLKKLNIKTKYFYGSRRAWRVPAMIESIDDEFFSNFGNLVGVDNYDKLISSLSISHNLFQKLFPETRLNKSSKISPAELVALREFFSKSTKYHDYLIEKAKEERKIVIDYIKQEINPDEKYAFVEYWARGYTQTCLRKLIDNAFDKPSECVFYYYRSILPSIDNDIRINYSTNNISLIPVEAIFANCPHGTVTGYKRELKKIVPVIARARFDAELYWSLGKYLKNFVNEFYSLPFTSDVSTIERHFSSFAFEWYRDHQDDPVLVNSMAHLLYSEASLGALREFAPAITSESLALIKQGKPVGAFTRSIKMSLARSTPSIKKEYQEYLKNPKALSAKPSNAKQKVLPTNTSKVKIKEPAKINQHLAAQGSDSRKIRLLNKLERNPEMFFSDSNKKIVRLAGKTAFNPILKPVLGNVIIKLSKKIIH